MDNTTVFYKKQGTKFVPVSEYNSELVDSLPYGCHVQVCRENGMSRRYNVDPALAPMVAASMILEDKLAAIISKSSRYNIEGKASTPLTPEQIKAWDNLNNSFEGGMVTMYGPSMQEIAKNILKEISAEAEKLLSNESIKAQYEHFILLSKLTKNEQENNIR
jgi:hypothetical protein